MDVSSLDHRTATKFNIRQYPTRRLYCQPSQLVFVHARNDRLDHLEDPAPLLKDLRTYESLVKDHAIGHHILELVEELAQLLASQDAVLNFQQIQIKSGAIWETVKPTWHDSPAYGSVVRYRSPKKIFHDTTWNSSDRFDVVYNGSLYPFWATRQNN